MTVRRTTYVVIAIAALALVWVGGCSQNDNPVMRQEISTRLPFKVTVPFEPLRYSPLGGGDDMNRFVSIAYASEEPLDVDQPPMPVLYLLHDFDGDGDYYGRYRLQAIMDDMFAKGEIGRMMVATVGANNRLGGSYYRNSVTSGEYEELLTQTIHFVEDLTFPKLAYTNNGGGRDARAISGHGMGGYGAMRYAAEHPEKFSAASSMSGPLSFNANDGAWLDDWTDDVLEENSARGDSAAFVTYITPNQTPPFVGSPFTKRFYAMAAAFSPRQIEKFDHYPDTCVLCQRVLGCNKPRDFDSCFHCSIFVAIPLAKTTLTTYNSLRDRPSKDTSACSFPVTPADLGVDFPFDWNGARVDSVWNLWLANDVKTYVENNPAALGDMAVYFDCGVEDELGYLMQNKDFDQTLQSMGIAHTYEEYTSSQGLVADHSTLIEERLREILKFHSDRFSRPPSVDN